jgi:hypothetical protein
VAPLAKSTFADGNLYVPNLFLRTWSDAAPGLGLRLAVWFALATLLGFWLMRGRRIGARGFARCWSLAGCRPLRTRGGRY